MRGIIRKMSVRRQWIARGHGSQSFKHMTCRGHEWKLCSPVSSSLESETRALLSGDVYCIHCGKKEKHSLSCLLFPQDALERLRKYQGK